MRIGLHRMRLYGPLVALSVLAGCAVLEVDVDVYKGPLANHEEIQLEEMSVMVIGAKPLLIQLRDNLEVERLKAEGSAAPGGYAGTGANTPITVAEFRKRAREAGWYSDGFIHPDPATNQPRLVDANAIRVNAILSLYEDIVSRDLPRFASWADAAGAWLANYSEALSVFRDEERPESRRSWAEMVDGMHEALRPRRFWLDDTLPIDHPILFGNEPNSDTGIEGLKRLARLRDAYRCFFAPGNPQYKNSGTIQNAHVLLWQWGDVNGPPAFVPNPAAVFGVHYDPILGPGLTSPAENKGAPGSDDWCRAEHFQELRYVVRQPSGLSEGIANQLALNRGANGLFEAIERDPGVVRVHADLLFPLDSPEKEIFIEDATKIAAAFRNAREALRGLFRETVQTLSSVTGAELSEEVGESIAQDMVELALRLVRIEHLLAVMQAAMTSQESGSLAQGELPGPVEDLWLALADTIRPKIEAYLNATNPDAPNRARRDQEFREMRQVLLAYAMGGASGEPQADRLRQFARSLLSMDDTIVTGTGLFGCAQRICVGTGTVARCEGTVLEVLVGHLPLRATRPGAQSSAMKQSVCRSTQLLEVETPAAGPGSRRAASKMQAPVPRAVPPPAPVRQEPVGEPGRESPRTRSQATQQRAPTAREGQGATQEMDRPSETPLAAPAEMAADGDGSGARAFKVSPHDHVQGLAAAA